MAPETRHLSLAEASAQPQSSATPAPEAPGLAAAPKQAPARPTER
jgi:hypothetical protein